MRISDWSSDVCSSDLLGGVTAELFEDVAIRLAPIDEDEAEAMLRTLKCWPLLDGWRGAPDADVAAAARAIATLSALAAANADTVETIEINPQSGRASCRARVCKYVLISGVAVS